MNFDKTNLLLYAVTDRSWLNGATLYDQVEAALKGGATFVQLREKELAESSYREEAGRIRDLCRSWRVPFVINDNVELAAELDADGVHVGQSDLEAEAARRILGPDKIIGVSVKTVEQALKAQAAGAAYLGVGAVFPTQSKQDADSITRDALTGITRAVEIPVVAIGGIQEHNIMELTGCGVHGVAVISALFAQPDIRLATQRLKALVEQIVK
ncbi:thiamine phosphate synthase [Proteiniclasticum sp. QWL-01]|uniref:thiamine phosphate synthase n=1 Tax=Proteiniclasticum sp. QWL-01 TaxID=3036945 RepID=UPI00241122D3|nr:thiamine phosphate synthase [Proteiniclasticum sp. QWL-01]WFF74304.1 thiamine phosphate synthase [Proteiniclasticum sp. QWL-01]